MTLTPLLNALFTVLPGAFLLGAAALVVRYRRGGPVERQQIRWVVAAAGILAPVSVGTALLGTAWIAEAAAVVLLPGAIAVAVLRHRLWDLGLVLRRTLLYALLTAVLLGAYVGGVLSLDAALPTAPELLPEVLVTGVVAIVALPLREVLQAALERVLFGARRDPHQVVRTLGRLLESSREPLLERVVAELSAALRLPRVAIELPDGSVTAAAGTGGPTGNGLRIPLQVGGQTVGALVTSRRHPAEPLSPADRRLLTDLAGHLGVVVQSASLDTALRRSHERLTHIRAEERSRLQRDLHDGLGPLLSAANMRVAAARNLLADPADVDRATTVLDTATGDLAGALEEVQRIIADLRPGQLAERGLVAALRDQVDHWAGRLTVTLEAPDPLPPIEPATETAAYRIVLEALRNAERHSGGGSARVRLAISDGTLTVDVRDDGAGLPATPVRVGAVGLRSMAERAEALGGAVRVESPAEGGTVVRGVLPGVRA
ncbi:GAF domain-containing sensor histidine kinase [Micromonospora sp. NPDC052213]|uniref:GAF domain-containing sensor histidine kinase n=1 Tax=Micromonospora sp. NPDC052213 TaxID=3155812 RepID=UPI003447B4F4